jgi:hypothetical protein
MSWFVTSPPGKYDERGRYPLAPLLEEQFELLFGDQPPVNPQGKSERAAWEYAKRYFEGTTAPEGVPPDMLARALEDYAAFGLGIPTFFGQRGRVLARFPGAPIDINPDAATVVYNPGQTIAAMQVRAIKNGVFVERLHPFVPAKYQAANAANVPAVPSPAPANPQ